MKTTHKLILVALIFGVCGFFWGYWNSSEPSKYQLRGKAQSDVPASHINLENVDFGKPPYSTAVLAGNKFAVRLFQELYEQDKDKNIFISPASIYFALGMTYNGTQGETQKAMAKAMGIDGLSLQQMNQAYAALLTRYSSDKSPVCFSNSIWLKAGVHFQADFLNSNREYFGAKAATLDFSSPSAISSINDWVKHKTCGRIEQVVDEIAPDTAMCLCNAAYFNAAWQAEFKERKTEDQPFYLTPSRKVVVPMMNSDKEQHCYGKNSDCEAISLGFRTYEHNVWILLPNRTISLDSFIKNFDLNRYTKGWDICEGVLSMPRFEFKYDSKEKMNTALTSLGMGSVFNSQQADFSGISPDVSLNRVLHSTFVHADEIGMEAAAATYCGEDVGDDEPLKPFRMVVDRPFVFVIQDWTTREILFMGVVKDPTKH